MITGTTKLAAVIGSPVRHSLSPVIHNAAFSAGALDWIYTAFEVAPGKAAEALAAMRVLGISGLSVTMPHKDDVAAAVDVLDPAATALRTANTVVLQDDGRLAGYSTDGAGFVASLREAGVEPSGMTVAVLGAGGAARSVIDALARVGVDQIVVINRSAARAEAAAQLGARRGRVGDVADIAHVDLVLNATSVGMGSDEAPFDLALLRSTQVVADLVYHPIETALLRAARRCGATAVDGLGMLVHQAVLQQQLWTGVSPDPAAMRAAAEHELVARHG
ncbi:MAG: shikimate dehydrogenase [Actinobacteria bacterium]|nr:shikimate dehydrogenase [Actinomycetota bacterium]